MTDNPAPDSLDVAAPAQADRGLLADVSRALVQLHKDVFGKGPTKARTYVTGDLVVCVLEEGLTRAERTLCEHGSHELVAVQRAALHEAAAERAIAIVERLFARRVASYVHGTNTHSETTSEVFLLEPQLTLGDEHEAVAAWAAQVRRRARSLREERAGRTAD